jgi:hypothetical protein
MKTNGPDPPSADDGPSFGLGGRAARAEIPAQAQVAAWARGRGSQLGRALLAERADPLESAGHLLDRAGVAMGHVRKLGLQAKLIKEMNFVFFSEAIFI